MKLICVSKNIVGKSLARRWLWAMGLVIGLLISACHQQSIVAATHTYSATENASSTSPTTAALMPEALRKAWWKEAVIYQIYPRSFQDSNGDGVGDLRGIIQRLDYIKSLGVDAVWLNPIYASPNADNGYDIKDYRAIQPEFGTMEDFDELLKGLHERGIKFVMDLVVNHSSDEHEWFKQSRSSRDNPYRDYYHWWPAEKGKPPYRYSMFEADGNAWAYDEKTNAYYLHIFAKKQPDLNWENPKVRQEVYAIMKFWADKGVDGFRMDAFQYVSKDTSFPEFPQGFEKNDLNRYYGMGPHLHDYLREMYEQIFSKYHVMSVSEGVGSTFADAHSLVDAERKELNMAYHFDVVGLGRTLGSFKLMDLKKVIGNWDGAFSQKGWLSIFLANHDQPRMVSKFGNDTPAFRALSSKMLNTLILTLRGTPYTYYGDELGMTNIGFSDPAQFTDVETLAKYGQALKRGEDPKQVMKELSFFSRENGRTPMQWSDAVNAGFSQAKPWMRVNPNFTAINVAAENADAQSPLNYFRELVQLRKHNPVLVYGSYHLELADNPNVYAYRRQLGGENWLVLLNFSSVLQTLELPAALQARELILNNYPLAPKLGASLQLSPYQALVLRL